MPRSSFPGRHEGRPCCCTGGCCPDSNIPDCVTVSLTPSCCGETIEVEICGSFGPPMPSLPESPQKKTGQMLGNWCFVPYEGETGKYILDNNAIGISCFYTADNTDTRWYIKINDDVADGHQWFPGTAPSDPFYSVVGSDPTIYPLVLVSCDPLLLTFGGEAYCSGQCTWRWVAACFLAGTKVKVPGGEVSIETLKPGDKVLSHTGEVETVDRMYEETHNVIIFIQDEDGRWTGTTPEHPFLLSDDPEDVVPAGEVVAGMVLAGGKKVQKVWFSETQTPVYNLSVTGDSTFLANGWAVHNK